MQAKVTEIQRAFRKLGMQPKQASHKLVQFRYNGKLILRTRLSHGSGDAKAVDYIRQELHLKEEDFRDLISCPLTLEGYVQILKEKGVISG